MSMSFEEKHPALSAVPVGNRLFRWMYEEGWGYILGLAIIVVSGFVLRLWNLTILDPYTDEYAHLLGARDLIETGTSGYSRAMLVTYMVMVFYKLGDATGFYEYLYWGRMPGIIFGTLTAIPIYLLARKISKPVAILSAALWITSPWAIGVSRTVREYSYYPLFLLVTLLVFIKLVEMLIKYDKKNNIKIFICLLIILVFHYYAFYIDTLSTLKFSLILLAGTTVYYMVIARKIINCWLYEKNTKYIFLFLLFIFTIFIVKIGASSSHVSLSDLRYDPYFFSWYLLPNGSPMHWWHGSAFQYIAILFLITGFIFSIVTRSKDYFLIFIIFFTITIFFMFFFDRYFRPRYVFYALPFFTILISAGLYSVVNLFGRIQHKKIAYVLILIAVIFIFKPQNTIYPITSDRHGYVLTTNEYHDQVYGTLEYIKEEIMDGDVFIGTIANSALMLTLNTLNKERFFNYSYRDPYRFEKIRSIINNNDRGFIILDSRRNGDWALGLPVNGSFLIGGVKVEMLRNMEGIQVYRWNNDVR